MAKKRLDELAIAKRVAKELNDGDVVNFGVGIGIVASTFIPPDITVINHSENGLIGYGRVLTKDEADKWDYNLTDIGGQFVTPLPGMVCTDAADVLDACRTGRVDVSVLGAYQVSEKGDLANWSTEVEGAWNIGGAKGFWGSVGGAMDISTGVKRVIVAMTHTTKNGKPKIVKECTLPLTTKGCVKVIVTDIAVIHVTEAGLLLKEIAPGWRVEEVQAITEPRLIVADDLKEIT